MTSPQGRNVVTRKEKLRRANSLAQGHSSGEGGAGQDSIPRLPASRACHPGNLGRGWMTPGPQDPHCHQGCFPAASPVHHPVHPCPQVLGGLCSFHSGPSFCTLPPKATPLHAPQAFLRMLLYMCGARGATRLLRLRIHKPLFISGAGRSFAGLQVSAQRKSSSLGQ